MKHDKTCGIELGYNACTCRTPEVESVMCGATILGPRVGRRVVAWRKQCRRMTRDLETGRCPDHQGPGPFGPGGRA